MARIRLEGEVVELRAGESVLDGLLRAGHAIPNSCRGGVCQSCLMKAEEGDVPPSAQSGLKDSLRSQGYFLSCSCRPDGDLVVAFPGTGLEWEAVVLEVRDVGAAVRVLRLEAPPEFSWRAGQFLTLFRPDGLARSYSIASLPSDGVVELHVRRIPGGAMSTWLHEIVAPGDRVRFRGAHGECFYVAGQPEQPLLLAGTGTGLAPLYGILRDALAHGHGGPITLFHGALNRAGLYFVDELTGLAASHGNVCYTACLLNDDAPGPNMRTGALDAVVLSAPLEPKASKAFLCGDPQLVQGLRKRLFLKGFSSRALFVDSFLPTP